ncbi:DUF4085 family protein [Lysinibacillus xylanilyticus]|uniref:DUF4085 family protein n=1 Tax=Lysinibacillus xylanilyticus TaxID=582475 RepID=UPI003D03BC1A
MKYFTQNWYREMQVNGFLTFPDSKEDWEESLNWKNEDGSSYIEILQAELEWRKEDLLTFLPAPFHPYILDGSLKTEYPSKELRDMAEEWNENYLSRRQIIRQQYLEQFEKIKEKLPSQVLEIHTKSLHDGEVLSFSESTITLIIAGTGVGWYGTNVKLTFSNVEKYSIPEQLEGSWWLYNEIYKTETGFELHVLFDYPLFELMIRARELKIETQYRL